MSRLPPPDESLFSPFMCAFVRFLASEVDRQSATEYWNECWSPHGAYIHLCSYEDVERDANGEAVRDARGRLVWRVLDLAVPSMGMESVANSKSARELWQLVAKEASECLLRFSRMCPGVPDASGVAFVDDVHAGLKRFEKAFPDALTQERTLQTTANEQ